MKINNNNIIIVKFAYVDLFNIFVQKFSFSLTFNLVDLVSSLTNYAPHTILVANNTIIVQVHVN